MRSQELPAAGMGLIFQFHYFHYICLLPPPDALPLLVEAAAGRHLVLKDSLVRKAVRMVGVGEWGVVSCNSLNKGSLNARDRSLIKGLQNIL